MTETPEEQPENERPLTREDVLRLIAENGGTAQGLDLSDAVFQQNPPPSLQNMDLKGIVLARAQMPKAFLFDTDMSGAYLCGANLGEANLENTILQNANLRGTILEKANLKGADLAAATLSGAFLFRADISSARIEFASWLEGKIVGEEKNCHFGLAGEVYRALKARYTVLGFHEVAGDFYYAEREAYRKAWRHGPSPPPDNLPNVRRDKKGDWNSREVWEIRKNWFFWTVSKALCGYGERPSWVIKWGAAIILWLTFIYLVGAWPSLPPTLEKALHALYYSTVSFTALGYGSWVQPDPEPWARGLGAAEALLGVLMTALFLTTFVRKMTR